MGRAASSHAKLVATGRAFVTAAIDAEVKPLFIARAFAANFDLGGGSYPVTPARTHFAFST